MPVLYRYHKSILKNLHKNREIPTGSRGTSTAVLAHRYIYGEAGDPSTRDAVCVVLPIEDVSSLAEVEQRERRVEILLKAPFLRVQPGPSGRNYTWPRLSGEPRETFRRMMRRALHQCDAIQDFEAQAATDLGIPVSAYLYRRPVPCPATAESDSGSSSDFGADSCGAPRQEAPEHPGMDGTTIEGQRRLHQVVVPDRARRLQIEYIKALPTPELMAIFMLIHVATTSWVESRIVMQNDAPRRLSLQENILRRGSCFLYCDVRGYGEMAKHRREMLDECTEMLDSIADESNSLLPPLFKVLLDELRARLGVPTEDVEAAVLGRVEKLLCSDEPVFATPPRTQEHGVDPLY